MKMTIVENDFNTEEEKTFAFFDKHCVQVASITINADGSVEFIGKNLEVYISDVGGRNERLVKGFVRS